MTMLDRSGVGIYYEDHGGGRDAPAVMLTHGFCASSRMWESQMVELGKRYRLITWDMRGHGRSDSPLEQSQYSEVLTVGDMAAVLDICGIDRAVIGGLSLGGYFSMAFNIVHPLRVRALLLCDTGPGFKKDEARRVWNERAERRAQDLEAQGIDFEKAGDEVRSAQHRSVGGLVRAARGMLIQRDGAVMQSLDKIMAPTMVLVGADDSMFLAAADYMAGKIVNARKVVIPGAGHASNMHQPALFNSAVDDFLKELAPE